MFRQGNLCSMPDSRSQQRVGEAASKAASDPSSPSCSLPHSNKSRAFVHADKGCLGKGWNEKKRKKSPLFMLLSFPLRLSVNEKKISPLWGRGEKKSAAGFNRGKLTGTITQWIQTLLTHKILHGSMLKIKSQALFKLHSANYWILHMHNTDRKNGLMCVTKKLS